MKDNKEKETTAPNKIWLRSEYDRYFETRSLIVNELKECIKQLLVQFPSTPIISSRIKNFESYYKKYLRAGKNNGDSFITDLLGIRVICPFINDLKDVEKLIGKKFEIKERDLKSHDTFREFGYESIHLLVKIPDDIISNFGNPGTDIIEIQLRTILQDAWAEVEHELVYKNEFDPFDEPMKRKLAAVNASLSLADTIFQEIRIIQQKHTEQIKKRRNSFYQKIEEATDDLLFTDELKKFEDPVFNTGLDLFSKNNESIDELLLNALTAHNQNRFNEAISQYTQILELKPNNTICSIILKHRGMANFACSLYNDAIEDFSQSLNLDEKSYKAAYYRGVVRSVTRDYLLAIDDYTQSLSINPYQPYCLFRRGQAYYHIGDFPQALSDCDKSLALEPQNESVVKLKNMLLEKLRM
jgi:putative GTP pyrophosphokinase